MFTENFLGENGLLTEQLLNQQSIGEILKCNEETAEYQLTLSKEEAILLMETRQEALRANHRIEIGGGTISKMIHFFRDSPYLSQYNYAMTLSELIDTFYYFKNETLDEISDDDLIELMKELFDGRCHGSIELLQGKEMERIAHNIRFGGWDFGEEAHEEDED
ncbi:MAG: hypothetical protein E7231_08910 [Cellulosilyticum sp.]|nr:hypothetical protein [Cellulosilyticum sp.]